MEDRDKRTLYCGNLPEKVTEELLYELFLQAGPLESVKIPKDKSGRSRNYAFITFKHEVSVFYTIALMQGITLYGKELRLELRSGVSEQRNPYMEVLRAHRQANHPGNTFIPPNLPDMSALPDRRNSFKGNHSLPDPRGGNEFADQNRWYSSTPVGSRSFIESSVQQQLLHNSYVNGFSHRSGSNFLSLHASPVGFAGERKVLGFDNMRTPIAGQLPFIQDNRSSLRSRRFY